uniref:Uncharacterized protein n=1 Tax=Mantoniella antarctica TaxID=81844 RepID=A0A7S0SL63_9CHLO|mmetsp:Transcript_27413/g.68637  ORF Transcript_27413/g.68637 Transcript_27413/m.68637 type:complete len:199 (+) Transcript_27413:64-660(+)
MDVAMERVPATASSASDDQADDALLQLQGRLHRWAVDQHQFLAGFSAVKFSQHGPGALFVFANCGLDDLLVADEDPESTAVRGLERQLILVWGGITSKAGVTLAELRTKVVCQTPGLKRSIEEGCDRESFPVVVCAGMEYATDDVAAGLRPPRAKGRYTGAGGVSVMSLQYGDFRAALKFGLSLSLGDALDLEVDRVD